MTRAGSLDDDRVSVVIATYNRWPELTRTLTELRALPERPHVVVVDNGSTDGTADNVRRHFPGVEVVKVAHGRGPAARNLGVSLTTTPYVAFADDDSWWAPGSLRSAADLLDRHPRLGLVAATVLVGPERRLDDVSREMADSPLPAAAGLPGAPIMGFLACAAVVRREAFEEAGGFHRLARFGGEETLLVIDLMSAGWALSYIEDLVAFHHPSPVRDASGRKASELWNRLLVAWLRFPASPALRITGDALVAATAARCRPLAPLVARRTAAVLRHRAVAAPDILDRLALVGVLTP